MKHCLVRFCAGTIVCLFIAVLGCVQKPAPPPPKPKAPPKPSLVQLDPRFLKKIRFFDTESRESLKKAVERSIGYFKRFPENKQISIASLSALFSTGDFIRSLQGFLRLLDSDSLNFQRLSTLFDFYTYSVDGNRVLFTGYYEPVIEGSLVRTPKFSYPLYPLPPDLIKVNLKDFGVNCGISTISGRLDGRRLVPYYTRRDIDNGAIANVKPLFWVKDPVDAFFLQIQGSGVVRLPDGTVRRVGYAGSNGRPYRSIGRYMIEQGFMTEEDMSMQAIKSYFRKHSDRMWEVLWQNESYVFFRWVNEGPKGSINVLLTPMRSIASDPVYYPRGALSYVITLVPGVKGGVRQFAGWVLHQDAGGAIRGPFRIDLFFGTGDDAGNLAGRMKYRGMVLLLLPKKENFR